MDVSFSPTLRAALLWPSAQMCAGPLLRIAAAATVVASTAARSGPNAHMPRWGGVGLDEARCLLRTRTGIVDMHLLPLLRSAAASDGGEDGRPGTFVEIGANDGLSGSQTLVLERCYNWTGLLIEGNPGTFARLAKSGRRAAKVQSACCNKTNGSVRFVYKGNSVSAQVDALTPSFVAKWGKLLRHGIQPSKCDPRRNGSKCHRRTPGCFPNPRSEYRSDRWPSSWRVSVSAWGRSCR